MEIWRDIRGYEGLYQVNQWGDIYSLYTVGRRKPPTKMCVAKSCRCKMHGTFGRSNRRFLWKNKPKGL